MAVDVIYVIIIVCIVVQLFLIWKVLHDTAKIVEVIDHRTHMVMSGLDRVEASTYRNRGLLIAIDDARGITGKEVSSSALPIEEDNLRWICTYCFKQEDNLMAQLTCSHCGAERVEPVEEWESVPYFMDGGVSLRPYPRPDRYPFKPYDMDR